MASREMAFLGIHLLLCWDAVSGAEYAMAYKDPNQPVKSRIRDLMQRMTLAEKIGQMTQIERKVATPQIMKDFFIGNHLLEFFWWRKRSCSSGLCRGLGGHDQRVAERVAVDAVGDSDDLWDRRYSWQQQRLQCDHIPPQRRSGSYQASLEESASRCLSKCQQPELRRVVLCRDPELVKRIGAATALEVRATGIPYAFAPCIAVNKEGDGEAACGSVCRDPRWGRCFESYSEDHRIVQAMTDIILGLQGDVPENHAKGFPYVAGGRKVVACAKHFVGDGGTQKGINENDTIIDPNGLFGIHMPAYLDAIAKGVSTVMISYSSWNGVKMHTNRDLITGVLKNKLGFKGLVISDWEGLDRITSPPGANYTYSVEAGINAGIDMVGERARELFISFALLCLLTSDSFWQVMVPKRYAEFIGNLTFLVKHKFISMSRIDDAVRRILRVKFALGLFDKPLADLSLADQLGKKVITAPSLSLGPSHIAPVMLYSAGTTILEAIRSTVDPATEVAFSENPDADLLRDHDFSYAIVVVGEHPYAETFGDSLNLTLAAPGPTTIQRVCGAVKCVVVLVTGRPVVIEPYLTVMDALVAAWLPGSEGQGVADVLFGDSGFTGRLPGTWFRSVDQLPMNAGDPHYDPLFPLGFGLTTEEPCISDV
ncbi:hypothetical protein GW17_00032230 [Ensete ventricosum]|nr:hypothetical protein GW17_00032230 [Ensete ventricosum]